MSLEKILILAILAEAVWETSKIEWQNGKVSVDRIGALVVGLLVALTTNADLLTIVGFDIIIPYSGVVLTGIIISRGGNVVHDLLVKLEKKEE